jgi:hypothetical protein
MWPLQLLDAEGKRCLSVDRCKAGFKPGLRKNGADPAGYAVGSGFSKSFFTAMVEGQRAD